MSGLSDYVEVALLNTLFRNQPFIVPPSAVYVAAFLTDPTDAGAGTEVSGGSYARVMVSTTGEWSAPSFGPGPSAVSNINPIVFPTATSAWGTVAYVAIFDALSGGNLIGSDALSTPVLISSGATLRFTAGSLSIQVGG